MEEKGTPLWIVSGKDREGRILTRYFLTSAGAIKMSAAMGHFGWLEVSITTAEAFDN